MPYDRELEAARKAAAQAGRIQSEFLNDLKLVERKEDDSPVTEVDKRCEASIRESLLKAFPSDGFLGEETGTSGGAGGRQWIVDPIDGTRPYIRGIPTYSTLIALEEDGVPVVGVMHFAGMQEQYWAARGQGAFCNGRPIRVSEVGELAHAMGSALGFVEKPDAPEAGAILRLLGRCDYAYGFMDAYSYASIAAGRLDLCVNLLDKPWDAAAPACIVTEAGGRFTDIRGNPSVHGGSSVFSNGRLHTAVLEQLRQG